MKNRHDVDIGACAIQQEVGQKAKKKVDSIHPLNCVGQNGA